MSVLVESDHSNRPLFLVTSTVWWQISQPNAQQNRFSFYTFWTSDLHHSCISLPRHNAGWQLSGRLPTGTLLCIFCLMACFCDLQINVESGLHHLGFHLKTGRPSVAAAPYRYKIYAILHNCLLSCWGSSIYFSRLCFELNMTLFAEWFWCGTLFAVNVGPSFIV